MCGLVGIVSLEGARIDDSLLGLYETLLYHDTIRGPHSTGAMWAYSKPYKKQKIQVFYHKAAVPGPQFLLTAPWLAEREKYSKRGTKEGVDMLAIFGHNRYATVGEVNEENAHPFLEGHNLLMHNGTLPGHETKDLIDKLKVDSRVLTHRMAEDGELSTLNKLTGAWALMWINTRDMTANVVRNWERPLARTIVRNMGKEFHVYASEGDMLEWVLSRSRKWKHVHDKVEEVNSHHLFKYSLKAAEHKVLELEQPKPTYNSYADGSWGSFYNYRKQVVVSSPKEKDSKHYLGKANGKDIFFDRDETIYFVPLDFEPYGTKKAGERGRVLGMVFDQQGKPLEEVEAWLHSIAAETGELMCKTKTVEGKRPVYECKINTAYRDVSKKQAGWTVSLSRQILTSYGYGLKEKRLQLPEMLDECDLASCWMCGSWEFEEDLQSIGDTKLCNECNEAIETMGKLH